jgi:RNA polymerase sigma-70 factor (ECF subfamily)
MVASDFKAEILPLSNKLLRFAAYFLKDEERARDVVQDIFLKLWHKKDDLSKVENIEAFAMQMTRNRCLDVIRAERTVPISAEVERQMKEKTIDVHTNVELTESARIIRDLVNRLPGIQKTVMQLRDIELFSYEEIAEITGLQANAIRVNLSRARSKVRDEFLKCTNYGTQRSENITATIF